MFWTEDEESGSEQGGVLPCSVATPLYPGPYSASTCNTPFVPRRVCHHRLFPEATCPVSTFLSLHLPFASSFIIFLSFISPLHALFSTFITSSSPSITSLSSFHLSSLLLFPLLSSTFLSPHPQYSVFFSHPLLSTSISASSLNIASLSFLHVSSLS